MSDSFGSTFRLRSLNSIRTTSAHSEHDNSIKPKSAKIQFKNQRMVLLWNLIITRTLGP